MSNNGNISSENDHYYTGFYKARVDNNGYGKDYYGDDAIKDEFNRNRLQVRVLGIMSFDKNEADINYIPIKALPWADQSAPLIGGYSKNNSGAYVLPDVGSWLYVFFENGNVNKPVYFGTVIGNNDLKDENQHLYKITTKSGTIIEINDDVNEDDNNKASEIKITTLKDTQLIISDKDDKEQILLKVKEQQLLLDYEKVILQDGVNDNILTMDDNGVKIENKNKNKITMDNKGIEVKGNVTMTGGSLTTKGIVSQPDPSNYCYNLVPNCLFAGSPHGGNKVQGT